MKFETDLAALGVRAGDTLLVHASYKALQPSGMTPDQVLQALLEHLGPNGTLVLPALSYLQVPRAVHDTRTTPSNVGLLPERFRLGFPAIRSLHPTHSVCALGARAAELTHDHGLDRTPCGVHSPFRKLLFTNAKILLLGCGLLPNTTMHAVEEIIGTPYLFGDERVYTITDRDGVTREHVYRDHGFAGWEQRYDRLLDHLPEHAWRSGPAAGATSYVLQTEAVLAAGLAALRKDRFAFVAPKPRG